MKQSDAIQHLNIMVRAIQRMRSIERETLEGQGMDKETIDTVLAYLSPWVFDDKKCPLPILVRVLDNLEKGIPLDPMTFYNFTVIASVSDPNIGIMCDLIGVIEDIPNYNFPKQPDPYWMRGWEAE